MYTYERVTAEIDLAAARHNLMQVRARVPEGTRVLAVVKADGYGHGAVEIAQAVDDIADYYAVAIAEEGAELRQAGITKPILVLGYTSPAQFAMLLDNDLTATIYRLDMARALSEEALRRGIRARIHLACDTGMGRIGFPANAEGVQQAAEAARLPGLETEGLFTHFARADEMDKTAANLQYEKYQAFYEGLVHEGVTVPLRHVCNSAGLMEFDDRFCDMVRAGIILYGLWPSEEVARDTLDLRPVMSLSSHIVHLKTVPAGTPISYGGTFVTERETVVATVPVGYADGWPRGLSNKGRVLVRGQYAPILGRICMDQFMIDVTGIEGVQMEDKVTLVGTDGAHTLTVEEQGDCAGRFNYEFVCCISKRVPRRYRGLPESKSKIG